MLIYLELFVFLGLLIYLVCRLINSHCPFCYSTKRIKIEKQYPGMAKLVITKCGNPECGRELKRRIIYPY